MPDITILSANLVTLVLESFLYGFLVLLFISTVYFLSTRKTLARQSASYHLTSVVFLGLVTLFLVVTTHWSIVIYQAFFAWIHLGNAASEHAFYADLSHPAEVAKVILFCIAVFLGDALVTYRLWIIWERKMNAVIFPIVALIVLAVSSAGLIIEVATWESNLLGAGFANESRPWEVVGCLFSLLANLYSTGLISFRIFRVTKAASPSDSTLKWFLSILIESAALQTCVTLVTVFPHDNTAEIRRAFLR
ncbi:hypothetical protein C8R45DRAFT_1222996 [Mycena sanguinolenta]|nr:hypothetical protein C8R45DRAFT_1222996 [Mycena sanguinolenta]